MMWTDRTETEYKSIAYILDKKVQASNDAKLHMTIPEFLIFLKDECNFDLCSAKQWRTLKTHEQKFPIKFIICRMLDYYGKRSGSKRVYNEKTNVLSYVKSKKVEQK